MKIAITAQEPSPDSQIDSRFGRAPWLMIFDPTNNSWQSIDNSAGLNAAHGAGIQAAQKVVDQQATAIITGAIGPKAYRSLQAAGIQIFHGAKGSVTQALQAFQAGDLDEANADDATGGI
jgi:predicted Fe-Mo cluster-binding NifX family protein